MILIHSIIALQLCAHSSSYNKDWYDEDTSRTE